MKKTTTIEHVADRAAAYGIPGIIVDGMDAISVYNVFREAAERARAGKGPTLMECKTYRFRGHFEGDPKGGGVYRSEAEMAEWKNKCPIRSFRTKLIDNEILTEKEVQEIEQRIIEEIEEAADFAQNSPYPPASEVRNNVFALDQQGGTGK